jgi:thioredoxin 1
MKTLILETTDTNFENDVLRAGLPVSLDFWAPWCAPCKAMAPMLERIAQQNEGKFKLVKYNVDQSENSFVRFKIRSVPTLVAFRDGEEVGRCTGGSPAVLKILLDTLLLDSAASVGRGVNAYGSDPDCKARCLDRIRQAIADGRLGGEQQEQGNDNLPSSIACGQFLEGGDTDALDLPPSLNALYDHFYERLPGDASATHFALNWLEAVPVGADLTAAARDYLLWIIKDLTQGVMRNVRPESEAPQPLTTLIELHQREAALEAVLPEEWEALRVCMESLFKTDSSELKNIFHAVMPVVKPAAAFPATAFFPLINMAAGLAVQQVASTWWTEEEAVVFHRTHRSMAPFMRSLGSRPPGPEALAEYQQKVDQFIVDSWAKAYLQFPGMEGKRALLQQAIPEAARKVHVSHAAYLLERIAAR